MVTGRSINVLTVLLVSLALVNLVGAPAETTLLMIGTPTVEPGSPRPGDLVIVSVSVTDEPYGVKNMTVVYTTDDWRSENLSVTAAYTIATELATAQMPSLSSGTHVAFYIVAFDNGGNRAVNNNSGAYFSYDVAGPLGSVSGPTAFFIVVLVVVALGLGLIAQKRKKRSVKGLPPGRDSFRVKPTPAQQELGSVFGKN